MGDVIARVIGVERHYVMGEVTSRALRGVDLDLRRGELVAIIGSSGSGKSTLLHILGCLDRPTLGRYELLGHDVGAISAEETARLRGQALGFVFQGFHLLQGTTAIENVELPLVYRGVPAAERRARALESLARVGLAERAHHTPAQLSGGQQQRVAIARALVTRPEVLFADEPTGNLDSKTSEEVLGVFQRLHKEEGLTIVLVTHDPEVARAATRVVTVRDGAIASDLPVHDRRVVVDLADLEQPHDASTRRARAADGGSIPPLALVAMGLKLAVQSLRRSKLRTGLTTLGILIGIAAVVTTSSLGAGAQERMEKEMLALGANMLVVMPGSTRSGGVRGAQGSGSGLSAADAVAIGNEVPSVRAVAPVASTSTQVVVGARNASTRATGTTAAYLDVRSWSVSEGAPFDEIAYRNGEKVCLIGQTVRANLFGHQDGTSSDNVLGATIRVGRLPCTVGGVLAPKGQSGFGQDQDDVVLMPLTTFRAHIARRGGDDVDSIVISARDEAAVPRALASTEALLRDRHRIAPGKDDDFSVRNLSELSAALDSQRAAISMLLLAIASVSLLVGGIGVMNIMLVSVTERTREIGIRLAIGGRPVDVLAQFLLEAVVLALVGGVAGLAVGALASTIVGQATSYSVALQPGSALLAVAISGGIGVVFGFFPARRAAALDPIVALRHE